MINYRTLLGFERIKTNWVLAVKVLRIERSYHEGNQDMPVTISFAHEEPKPLLSTSREIRLTALAAMPDFLRACNEALDNFLNELMGKEKKTFFEPQNKLTQGFAT